MYTQQAQRIINSHHHQDRKRQEIMAEMTRKMGSADMAAVAYAIAQDVYDTYYPTKAQCREVMAAHA